MKSLWLLLIFLCLFYSVDAQKIDASGRVVDTLNQPLIGATVMLLQAKDSVLTKFGITNEMGHFKLEKISPDEFILQITYLGFANKSQPISLANMLEDKDLGVFMLEPESAMLDQVEVKAAHIPIAIKKDTIEYNAAAFQTRPNADVEELLKKLPGVEVDRNGGIKAQGETVQKVLVDGKEFFGNDPKIATKNLPADAVDKVQVFDKKSDIAEFSGIDDGREAKTINLSLKEDKKKGYFGRITTGYGSEDRYENKLNVNRFGGKFQLSAIGMINNTNQQGFSINDYINMMGGLNNLLAGGGGGITLNSDEVGLPLDVGEDNQGFTTTNAGGINLNWDINNKTKLHTSYFFNGINKEYDINDTQQNLLGNQSFKSSRNTEQKQQRTGHRININLTSKIDSFQTVKVRSNFGFNKKDNHNISDSETYNLLNQLENKGTRNWKNKGQDFRWNTNLTYLKRFSKKGRFFTTNLAIEQQQGDQTAKLTALNEFFANNGSKDSLQQEHLEDNQQINYGAGITYTEPIGKRKYLEINYSYQNYTTESNKKVFDVSESNNFFNTQLSNHFQRDYLYHKTGLNYKWTHKKWNLNTGIDAQKASLKGHLFLSDTQINKDFYNVLPKFNFNYDFKSTRSIEVNYRTSVNEPSMEQLQPIVDNNDPLNIYEGNPDLIPEYLQNLRVQYNSFDQFSGISVFASMDANFTKNAIVNARDLDAKFRQSVQPVNFGDSKRLGSYLSFGAPVKWIKCRLDFSANYDVDLGNYIVNSVVNPYENKRTKWRLSLSNRHTDIVDIAIGYKWILNEANYSQETDLNQRFKEQLWFGDFRLNLGTAFTVSTSMDYTKYDNASFGKASDIAIWQAEIAYHFLKNKRGTLTISGHDLLNQNIGINRHNQLNFLLEQRIASLGRYFLLQFSYKLSAFGNEDNGIEVVKSR